jgi:hypothetical protein
VPWRDRSPCAPVTAREVAAAQRLFSGYFPKTRAEA